MAAGALPQALPQPASSTSNPALRADHVSIGYRPALDGLRACAVLAVLAFHCDVITGGWLGVDLFFVLSGYLITSLLVVEVAATGNVALGAFWMRRLRRLLPAVGLLLVLIVVLHRLGQISIRARGIWGALTYSANWVQLSAHVGYWDTFADPDPLSHLWSLAVEEQFYLVWPLAVWCALRWWGPRGIHRIAIVLVVVAVAVQMLGLGQGWSIDRMYVATDTRALAFVLGASATAPVIQRWILRAGAAAAVIAAAVWTAGALWLSGDSTSIFRGWLQAMSCSAAVLIVVAATLQRGPLTWSPLRAIGRWSYGIYLFHWPLTISAEIAELRAPLRFVAVTAGSTALAALSYRLVEMPIRQRRMPHSATIAVVATTILATVVALVVAQPAAPLLADLPVLAPRPSAPSGASPAAPEAGRVIVVGDSVPALAASALAGEAERRSLELEVNAQPGCVASQYSIDQLAPAVCMPFIDGIRDRIQTVQPDVIVLWFGGTGRFFQSNGVQLDFCSTEGGVAYRDRLGFLAMQTNSQERQVVVVLPVPRADLDADAAAGANCEAALIRSEQRRLKYRVIELGSLVCPSFPADCQRVARPDGLHYSAAGAAIVARFVFDQLDL